MSQDEFNYPKIKEMKELTISLTDCVCHMAQNIRAYSLICPTPEEIDGKDVDSTKQMIAQRSCARLMELTMRIREELILLGVSYEKES